MCDQDGCIGIQLDGGGCLAHAEDEQREAEFERVLVVALGVRHDSRTAPSVGTCTGPLTRSWTPCMR
jgi:hypothetical protein